MKAARILLAAGAGGGGFIQVILKKDVTKEQLHERLHGVFQDSGVDVWRNDVVEHQSHSCCCYRREQGVGDGVAEYLTGICLVAQGCQGCDDCQGYGWYCQKLE